SFTGGGSMADSGGRKIGVEGERECKMSLREINESFRVLGSEMKLVTSEVDRNDKSIKARTARNAVLNKEIDAQKQKTSTLEKALAKDRNSTRLNSSHVSISYAVFCLNIKNNTN